MQLHLPWPLRVASVNLHPIKRPFPRLLSPCLIGVARAPSTTRAVATSSSASCSRKRRIQDKQLHQVSKLSHDRSVITCRTESERAGASERAVGREKDRPPSSFTPPSSCNTCQVVAAHDRSANHSAERAGQSAGRERDNHLVFLLLNCSRTACVPPGRS